jgi:type VI secretion system secreted protein Hcp
MAFDSFLYFQQDKGSKDLVPEGESTDPQFASFKAFEIKSFGFGAANNVTISSQSRGAGAGKATFEKFKFSKSCDSGSPLLFTACAAGKHIDYAVLVLRKAGGATGGTFQPPYLIFIFNFVYIDTIAWSGSSGDDVPSEDVTFAYGAMQITYRKQDSTGKLIGSPYDGVWSAVLNRPHLAVVDGGGGTPPSLPTGISAKAAQY